MMTPNGVHLISKVQTFYTKIIEIEQWNIRKRVSKIFF